MLQDLMKAVFAGVWGGDSLRAFFLLALLALHAKGQGERERHYNSDVSSFHLVPHLDQNFVVVITVNCEFIFLGTLWNQLSVETKLFSILKKKLNCCEFWV